MAEWYLFAVASKLLALTLMRKIGFYRLASAPVPGYV